MRPRKYLVPLKTRTAATMIEKNYLISDFCRWDYWGQAIGRYVILKKLYYISDYGYPSVVTLKTRLLQADTVHYQQKPF